VAKKHSIADARNNLPSLVRAAESGRVVELTRRGEPVAVLVGRKRYERMIAENRGFSASYRDFVENVDLNELAFDPEEFLTGVRPGGLERAVDL